MISVKGWEMGTLSGSATSGQCLDSGGLCLDCVYFSRHQGTPVCVGPSWGYLTSWGGPRGAVWVVPGAEQRLVDIVNKNSNL